mmetsp:Transcript_21447/g.49497  ORF Transcript_21447/g.49497 Transcript_21447/m.49497 type:complete len:110 (-) Transcript_21447:496-825(-)
MISGVTATPDCGAAGAQKKGHYDLTCVWLPFHNTLFFHISAHLCPVGAPVPFLVFWFSKPLSIVLLLDRDDECFSFPTSDSKAATEWREMASETDAVPPTAVSGARKFT